MHAFLIALAIFSLRILDVSIGTVRVLYTVRGKRTVSALMGVVESAIWIFAISKAFKYVDNPMSMIGWAIGFGTGTAVGITLEQKIGSGSILMRCIIREKAMELRDALYACDFGVTAMRGEGKDGEVWILFIVAPRRRGRELLHLVQRIDPGAFVTVDPITQAMGGYLPVTAHPASVRK